MLNACCFTRKLLCHGAAHFLVHMHIANANKWSGAGILERKQNVMQVCPVAYMVRM